MSHYSVLKWETFSKLGISNQPTSIGNLCVLGDGEGALLWGREMSRNCRGEKERKEI